MLFANESFGNVLVHVSLPYSKNQTINYLKLCSKSDHLKEIY